MYLNMTHLWYTMFTVPLVILGHSIGGLKRFMESTAKNVTKKNFKKD